MTREGRSLHIAWIGAGPAGRETGGVPGVATELLAGLAAMGHRVDCFLIGSGSGERLPERLADSDNLTFVWGRVAWRWSGWYSRVRIGAFVTSLAARALAFVRLRREVLHRHREDPYDLVYQFSNIESLSLPRRLTRQVPLVMQPETHAAGELRFLVRERKLSLRCQPAYTLAIACATMAVRAVVQRRAIRRASLVIAISSVFRDHLVADYGIALERCVVIPNAIRVERFADADVRRAASDPAVVLVLGRVSARKGVEDVVALAQALRERPELRAFVRVMGGPTLWSDYTKLLEELPKETSEYVGRFPPTEVPAELARSDVLLQASRYEPFALTVAEALASGVPVVATSEVGAIEGVDRSVVAEVAPGSVQEIVAGIAKLLGKLRADAPATRSRAREEAQRLFAAEVVCEQIDAELQRLVAHAPASTGQPPTDAVEG